jgi:hypothetical protein
MQKQTKSEDSFSRFFLILFDFNAFDPSTAAAIHWHKHNHSTHCSNAFCAISFSVDLWLIYIITHVMLRLIRSQSQQRQETFLCAKNATKRKRQNFFSRFLSSPPHQNIRKSINEFGSLFSRPNIPSTSESSVVHLLTAGKRDLNSRRRRWWVWLAGVFICQ